MIKFHVIKADSDRSVCGRDVEKHTNGLYINDIVDQDEAVFQMKKSYSHYIEECRCKKCEQWLERNAKQWHECPNCNGTGEGYDGHECCICHGYGGSYQE